MTAHKKAEELIDKYTNLTDKCSCLEYMCICFRIGEYDAKRCALIAVDELITETGLKYWYEVKKEIEKL